MSTTTEAVAVPSPTQAQILAALVSLANEKQGAEFKNVSVVREGAQIVVPEDMSITDAITWLDRKRKEEETEVAVNEIVDAYPQEGAYAFAKALAKLYGFTALIPTPTFFGPKPPTMIGVEVEFGRTEQVPWGRMQVPKIEGFLETGYAWKDDRLMFRIGGTVKAKHRREITKLAALTRELVANESVYRGKAIRVSFPEKDDEPNPNDCPKFMDTRNIRANELIFSDEVKQSVHTNLFVPIEHAQQCRKYGVPLKRGILLEGEYGTGKTQTAHVAARKCVDNGWTFIYLGDVKKLEQAIHFAKQYQPAVIFAEDIDQVMNGERDEDNEMNDILNTIDGVDTKGTEIIVVLTTNFVGDIDVAMLRPGRLDAVISVKAPDAKAAMQLVRLYARGLLDEEDDYSIVGSKLEGLIPAFIREVVERSKLAAIGRDPEGQLVLNAADLELAADQINAHLELMETEEVDERPDIVKAADLLGTHLGTHMARAKTLSNGHDANPS